MARVTYEVSPPTLGIRAICLRPSLAQVWLAAPVAVATLLASFLPAESVDIWWSLLLGDPRRPPVDPIVFTPVVGPSANVQWAAQRILASINAIGGLPLLLVFRAVVVAATVALLELLALRSGASATQAGRGALLALPLVLAGGALRPQLLILPLLPLLLLLGGPLAGRPYVRWAVAGLVALWSNLHGSFVLAPVLLALLAVGATKRLVLERVQLAAIAATAPLASPWGLAVYPSVLEVASFNGGGAGSMALEWRPLDLKSVVGGFFLIEVLATGIGLVRVSPRLRLSWGAVLFPLAFVALAVGRHSIWFGLAAVPLAARALGRDKTTSTGRPGLNLALLATLTLAAVLGLSRPLINGSQLATDTPLGLATELSRLRPTRLFAYSDWGGYFAWRLQPDGRVFVDDRFEQHPPDVWREYRSISLAEPGWEELLNAHAIEALALERVIQAPLIEAARGSPRWLQIYADAQGVIYVRSGEH